MLNIKKWSLIGSLGLFVVLNSFTASSVRAEDVIAHMPESTGDGTLSLYPNPIIIYSSAPVMPPTESIGSAPTATASFNDPSPINVIVPSAGELVTGSNELTKSNPVAMPVFNPAVTPAMVPADGNIVNQTGVTQATHMVEDNGVIKIVSDSAK